jgi:hypothetical protein
MTSNPSDTNNEELRRRIVSRLMDNNDLRKLDVNDVIIIADDIVSLAASRDQQIALAAQLEGAKYLWQQINSAPKDSWYGTAYETLEKIKIVLKAQEKS